MEGHSQTRRAMERTLLIAVAAEALVGRIIVKGLEKKPQIIRGVPQKVTPPDWFVAIDYLALFLLYFVTVVGVLTLVVGRLEHAQAARRDGRARVELVPAGIFTLVLAAAVAGGATNHAGPPWLVWGGLAGVAATAVFMTWWRRAGLMTSLGVTAVALPLVIYGGGALLTRRLWSEAEIFDGAARASFGAATRLAVTVAALASPYLLAPRPLSRTVVRPAPFIAGLAVAATGAVLLSLDYLSTIAAINRSLGLDLEPRAASRWIAFYLLAFATVAWTIVACLTAPTPARRRLGVGLGLVVLGGLGFGWPMNFAVAAVGILAMADASEAEREERRAWGPATPMIDDEIWHGFVGQVVTRLRADGGEVSAVSVRGDHGQIATVVLAERAGVPVRLCVTRVAGCVISVDLICGRESAAAPRWALVAREPGGHPEPPAAAGVGFVVDDAVFDARFRCRGERAALIAAIDADDRAKLAAGVEGWLAGWPGEALRHRVYPGHGASVDELLPLTELSARRALPPAAATPLLLHVELCAQIARRMGAAIELEAEPKADASVS